MWGLDQKEPAGAPGSLSLSLDTPVTELGGPDSEGQCGGLEEPRQWLERRPWSEARRKAALGTLESQSQGVHKGPRGREGASRPASSLGLRHLTLKIQAGEGGPALRSPRCA